MSSYSCSFCTPTINFLFMNLLRGHFPAMPLLLYLVMRPAHITPSLLPCLFKSPPWCNDMDCWNVCVICKAHTELYWTVGDKSKKIKKRICMHIWHSARPKGQWCNCNHRHYTETKAWEHMLPQLYWPTRKLWNSPTCPPHLQN
jgi:hypothetical protein